MTSASTRVLNTRPRIAITSAGEGEPVVLLHGLGSVKENWQSQLQALSKTRFVVAWDARGYGASDDYDGELDFAADFSTDLLGVLDDLGIARAHLVGLSMGGMIAQCFYFLHPQRVATLTLADTFHSFAALGHQAVEGFRAARLRPLLEGKEPADLAAAAADAMLAPGAPREARDTLVASLAGLRKASYVKTVEALLRQPPVGRLEDIEVPTLVLTGELDRLAPVAVAQDMVRKIPNAELHVVVGSGHLSNLECPADFNAAVGRFLEAQSMSLRNGG